MAHDGETIGKFVRRLTPSGLKAIDSLCHLLDDLKLEPADPRVAAALAALRAGCEVRKRLRKGT